ncbi:hypothetical protein MLD38_020310 [Melastoma candidum]|uniref:Uncharacterized protein n=1 Tax=Melastoma candidum TaxID=119954 RepID=A0ACB9QC42_9MYRT|nr:hypothetical protein MLD38_020310 [Melastoma candidum]
MIKEEIKRKEKRIVYVTSFFGSLTNFHENRALPCPVLFLSSSSFLIADVSSDGDGGHLSLALRMIDVLHRICRFWIEDESIFTSSLSSAIMVLEWLRPDLLLQGQFPEHSDCSI